MKKLFTYLMITGLIVMSTTNGWGQTEILNAWNTNGLSEVTADGWGATTVATNMVQGELSRGSGVTATSLANGFSAEGWNVTSLAEAKTSNKFFHFFVEASPESELSLDEISFRTRRTGTGPNRLQLAYSLDNDTYVDIGSEIVYENTTDGFAHDPVDLSGILALQNVEKVYFRLYGWGASSSSGTLAFGRTGAGTNDLIIEGTVASAGDDPLLIADPSSLDGFAYLEGHGPSGSQSFTVSGENLHPADATITISAPANFQVSLDDSDFNDSKTVDATDGSLSQIIYVRLAVGLGDGQYSGNVEINGGDAEEKIVEVFGSVFNVKEDFDNYPETTSSYNSGDFIGVLGNTWNYVNGRGTPTIDEATVVLRNNTLASLNSIIPGGITGFSFDYMQAFGTNVNLEVYINNEIVATVTSDGEQDIVKNSGYIAVPDINGTYFIEFKQGSGGGQVAIDNLMWNQGDFPLPSAVPYEEDFNSFSFDQGTEIINFGVTNEWFFQSTEDELKYEGNWGDASIFSAGFRGNSSVMGYQHTASTGTFTATLPVANNTGAVIEELFISYLGKVAREIEVRSPEWTVTVDGDEVSYLSFSTEDGNDKYVSAIVKGLNIQNGELFTISWSSSRGDGSGASKQIGIADVEISAASHYTASSNPAEIPSDATIFVDSHVTLSDPLEVKNLYIETDGIFTISSEGSLEVTGAIINNATSPLILQSPENNGAAGSLIVDSYRGTGEIRAERYISGYTSNIDGWHLFASPVDNFVVEGSAFQPSTVEGQEDDLYYWDEAEGTAGLWMNWKAGAFNFDAGKGYLLAFKNSGKRSIQGVPHNNSIEFEDLSYNNPNEGSTWHLLGNHFTSAIQWRAADWSRTAIGGVAKVMNVSNGSYIDINDTDIIPAMQGFFVEVTDSDNSITIPKVAQQHSAQNWYKNVPANRLLLEAKDLDNGLAQQSVLILNPSATGNYNPEYDSRFLGLYAPEFYSIKDGRELSTNALPEINSEISIPFGFVKNQGSNFAIELANSLEGQIIYLTDKLLSLTHNLSENPVYQFTSSEGDDPNRFLIHFGALSLDDKRAVAAASAYVIGNTLYVLNARGQTQLEVFDLQGRLLQSQSFKAEGLHSQPIKLPAGMYVVRIMDAEGVKTTRIMLN